MEQEELVELLAEYNREILEHQRKHEQNIRWQLERAKEKMALIEQECAYWRERCKRLEGEAAGDVRGVS